MEIVDIEGIWQLNSQGRLLDAEGAQCEMLGGLDLVVHDRDGMTYVIKPEAFRRNLKLLHVARQAYSRNGWGAPPF